MDSGNRPWELAQEECLIVIRIAKNWKSTPIPTLQEWHAKVRYIRFMSSLPLYVSSDQEMLMPGECSRNTGRN